MECSHNKKYRLHFAKISVSILCNKCTDPSFMYTYSNTFAKVAFLNFITNLIVSMYIFYQ